MESISSSAFLDAQQLDALFKQYHRHGGGDRRLHDRLFRLTDAPDPYGHSAGVRDGVMSMLIGVAARKSIAQGGPVRIASLTDLVPMAKRSAVQ